MSRWSTVWAPSVFSAVVYAASRSDRSPESRHVRATSQSEQTPSRPGRDETVHGPVVLIGGVSSVALLERIQTGDRDALAILYKALFDELWSIAVIRTQSADRAEDAIQNVFLRFWMRRDQVDAYIDVRVYLAAAVRNQTRDMTKHHRVSGAAERAITESRRDLPGIGEKPALPDLQFERREFLKAYHQAISTLTEQEKLAVHLRWEREMTFEQIGDILSLSKVGARKVVLRAQKKVQILLAQYRD